MIIPIVAVLSKNDICEIQSAGNQRFFSTNLVGTSETTRVTPFSKDFCEWLGGIIDGKGCLVPHTGSRLSCLEVTVDLEDVPLLMLIKSKLGGSVRPCSGARAYQYRLYNRDNMLKLINCINGTIHYSSRLKQLHQICTMFNIQCQLPYPLNTKNCWFAGLFDADGIISLESESKVPHLQIYVTTKYLCDVRHYKNVFGGHIYFDTSRGGVYRWLVDNRTDIGILQAYHKQTRMFRSRKARRFFLIDEYWQLFDLRAYEPNNSAHKSWERFMDRWTFTKTGDDIVQVV